MASSGMWASTPAFRKKVHAPLDGLSFAGGFSLKVGDLASRLGRYTLKLNTYDGGTQIFFDPVPAEYEFTAVDVWTPNDDLLWSAKSVVPDVSRRQRQV